MQRILVWDWPTRLIHWVLAALVFFSWGSAEYGHMDLHRYSGYTILGLLVFRIYWGFFGSHTARFANFVKGPRAVVDSIRRRSGSGPTAYSLQPSASPIGHNPLGALSVVALLALLVAQVTIGLFTVDIDGLESGPLSYLVTFDMGRAFAEAHEFVFNLLLAFIVLHIAAVLFYLLVKRNNLVTPMFTGRKAHPEPSAVPSVVAPLLRVLIGALLAGAVVWAIV